MLSASSDENSADIGTGDHLFFGYFAGISAAFIFKIFDYDVQITPYWITMNTFFKITMYDNYEECGSTYLPIGGPNFKTAIRLTDYVSIDFTLGSLFMDRIRWYNQTFYNGLRASTYSVSISAILPYGESCCTF